MPEYEVTEIEVEGTQVITADDGTTIEDNNPKLFLVKKKTEGAE